MTSRSSEVNYLEVDDFRILVEQLIAAREEFSEDIPPFYTRYPGILESITGQLKANYFGVELYPDLETKGAWLFYPINKNHPFLNGNKRVSVIALYEFLERNFNELFFNEKNLNEDLYEMALRTASSKPEEIDSIIKYLKQKIEEFTISS